MEFKVKRDFIPIFVVNILILLVAICSILFFLQSIGWLIVVIIVDTFAFILYNSSIIFAKCTITEEKLIYRTGMFKYSIPLDKIAKVTKAKNYHPSLSLSIDRIRILVVGETGKQCAYYISVEDSKKFMANLKPNPELKKVKDEIPTPLTEIKEEPKQEEIKQEIKEEVVVEPKTSVKTTTKTSATTKKPATKASTAKKTSTTTKKTTSTSKKEN